MKTWKNERNRHVSGCYFGILNRIFHSMEDEEIIERYRNKIHILDMELLQSRITEM